MLLLQKEVEEEKQARVGQVSDLLSWVKGLQGRTGGPNAESSLAAQQVGGGFKTVTLQRSVRIVSMLRSVSSLKAISEQLAARKDQVSEAIRSTQGFLMSKQASK